MKKIVLVSLLFILPLAFLSSCNKDEKGTIAGKWQFYASEISFDGKVLIDSGELTTDCQKTGWLEYATDGTYTNVDDCLQTTSTGTWQLQDKTLTVTVGGIVQTFTVKSVSNVELIIDATEGYSIGGLGFGMEGTKVLIKYKRIG